MTSSERDEAHLYLRKIEPALTVGTDAHHAFALLRSLVGEVHGAADHVPRAPRRGRKPKVAEAGGEGGTP